VMEICRGQVGKHGGCVRISSHVRSAHFKSLPCLATRLTRLVVRRCVRLAAAAMIASAGVTEGLMMYLCLKKTVAEIRVVHEDGVHTFQHQ
jgi:hypothetical protein